jgi:hypothetical protein
MHYFRTKLFSCHFQNYILIYTTCLESADTDSLLFTVWLLLCKDVGLQACDTRERKGKSISFLPLFFANKDLGAINFGIILHHGIDDVG